MTKDQLKEAQFNHALAGVRQGEPTPADFEIISRPPAYLKTGDVETYQKALTDPRIPDHVLSKYIKRTKLTQEKTGISERFLESSYLLNPKVPASHLLNCYKYNYFKIYLAQNKSIPKDLIPEFIKTHAEEVSANASLSPDNFANLFIRGQGHFYILKNLFSNPSLPMEYLEDEFQKNQVSQASFWVFYNKKTPLHMLEHYLKKALEIYQQGLFSLIANHPNLSPDLLDELMETPLMLEELGLRPNLSSSQVERMLSFDNMLNTRNLTKNPHLSKESYFYLFENIKNKHPTDSKSISYINLSLNRGIPTEILLQLLDGSFSEEVRINTRTHPKSPENQIRNLLKIPVAVLD